MKMAKPQTMTVQSLEKMGAARVFCHQNDLLETKEAED
jgi:hypothetical protein